MSNTLYHFTAAHLVPSILREGLTRGQIPITLDLNKPRLKTGYQWLTTNSNWHQEWETSEHLPYRRNEARLTIEIPERYQDNVLRWLDVGRTLVPHATLETLSRFGDPEHWRLYHGTVKSKWIAKVEANPTGAPHVWPTVKAVSQLMEKAQRD